MTEKFLPAERRRLRKLLEPYGAIKDCADKTGIHRSTIARALKTGEASGMVMIRIRNYIDGFSSRMFVDIENAA